jgi:hypothetical protein
MTSQINAVLVAARSADLDREASGRRAEPDRGASATRRSVRPALRARFAAVRP